MLRYTINRVLLTIPTLLGVAVLVFFMLRIVPGDIVEVKLRGDGGNVSQETIDMERKRLGLDKPLDQSIRRLDGRARDPRSRQVDVDRAAGDRGDRTRLELSLQVAIMATIIAVLLADSARHHGRAHARHLGRLSHADRDHRRIVDSVVLVRHADHAWPCSRSSNGCRRSPSRRSMSIRSPISTQLIWPALAVGYRYCAVTARMIRSSLLEVLNEDYIRTARAKGVYEQLVISRHALRNALLPAITVIGLEFTFLIGGLVVTEQVFNLNGIGKLFVQSVSRNDFTLIQGMVMLIAAFYVFVNLVIDLLYAVFDPRIRYG